MAFRKAATTTLLLSIACGGGDRSPAPTVPVVATGLSTGSILTFRLGDTGDAVAGAEVVIDGQAYRTSPSGDVQIQRETRFGAPLHATSPAMLDRVTLLPRDERVLYLWPREPEPGLSEGYTANLVYTWGDAAVGTDSLWRLQAGTTSVAVHLSPELASDPDASASHDEAAAIMTAATGGQVRYFITTQRPATGVIYDALIDGNAGNCPKDAIRAFVSYRRGGRGAIGGSINYCFREAARSGTVLHEMGHTFGLSHSTVREDVMYGGGFHSQRRTALSVREARAMLLMLRRPVGNLFPDNDRPADASSVRAPAIVECQ